MTAFNNNCDISGESLNFLNKIVNNLS